MKVPSTIAFSKRWRGRICGPTWATAAGSACDSHHDTSPSGTCTRTASGHDATAMIAAATDGPAARGRRDDQRVVSDASAEFGAREDEPDAARR